MSLRNSQQSSKEDKTYYTFSNFKKDLNDGFYSDFKDFMSGSRKMYYEIIDSFFNKEDSPFFNYRVYIGLLLVVIFVLFYIFVNETEMQTKYKQVIVFIMFSVFTVIFTFFIYRNEESLVFNNNVSDIKKYDIKKRTLIKKKDNKEEFHYENFRDSIRKPIGKLMLSLFSYIFTIVGVVLLIGLFFWSINNSHILFKIFEIFLGISIIVVFLSIIAKLFSITIDDCNIDNIYNMSMMNKIYCFIKNFIFFIPCLLIVFVTKMRNELNITPPVVFILLIIEILIVLTIIFIPMLYKYLTNINGNNLLSDGPVYLNNRKTIGKYQELNKEESKNKGHTFSITNPFNDTQSIKYRFGSEKDMNLTKYKYSYSIKFNLYINPQEYNTRASYNTETNLFNYANKPLILYNGRTKEIIIRTQTTKNEGKQYDLIYKTSDFKYQKWIPFLINYSNNKIDIFMNNKLVGSKENVSPYFTNDEVIIGENNGIHGSIDEVYYYDKIQTPDTFESFFKTNDKYNNHNFGNVHDDFTVNKSNITNNIPDFKRIKAELI